LITTPAISSIAAGPKCAASTSWCCWNAWTTPESEASVSPSAYCRAACSSSVKRPVSHHAVNDPDGRVALADAVPFPDLLPPGERLISMTSARWARAVETRAARP